MAGLFEPFRRLHQGRQCVGQADAELQQKPVDLVDQRGAPAYPGLADAMLGGEDLLLDGLHRDVAGFGRQAVSQMPSASR